MITEDTIMETWKHRELTPENQEQYLPKNDKNMEEGTNELIKTKNDATKILKHWNLKLKILPIYKSDEKRYLHNFRGYIIKYPRQDTVAIIMEKIIEYKIENTIEKTQCGFKRDKSAIN